VKAIVDRFAFQLYLLSQMRPAAVVDAALQSIRATREDLARASDAAVRFGFDSPVHSAQLYREVLGEPSASEKDLSVAPDSPLGGSTILHFNLTLWPGFDFVVREHPDGYAWGAGFDRTRGTAVPGLRSILDLCQWGFQESEVTARLGPPTREDAWSGWEDLSYPIRESPSGPVRRFVLRFDLNLLQSWSPSWTW
jgi:hypothetical protein